MKQEKGAVAVIIAILIVVLIGMAAYAIDVGSLYHERRHLQTVADAAALAGAQELPESPGNAVSKASEYAEFHGVSAENLEISIGNELTVNDKIMVTSKNPDPPLYFAGVLTKGPTPVAAYAEAIIATPLQINNVVPWGVVEQDGWGIGETVVLMYDEPHPEGGTGWFGALDLPSYSGTGGASGYRENIEKGANIDLTEGQTVWTEQGKMVGPTGQGIDDRVDTWYGFDYLVTQNSSGLYTLQYNEPQFIIVPIVEPLDDKETGKRDFKILRFEPFILMDFNHKGQEAEVIGKFIDIALVQNYGEVGAVGQGLRVIRLTK